MKCPNCGNNDVNLFELNAPVRRDATEALCVARVSPDMSADECWHEPSDYDANGRVECGAVIEL